MRSIRAAQALSSRTLLLSSRALHGAAASTATSAGPGGRRLGAQPLPLSQAASSSSSRAMPGGIAGAVSFSLTFATMAAAEAKAKERPPLDLLPQNVVLYQYQACPFCNKVRAFLDYHDIPYKVVEVNPLSKKEIKWSEYKKVPILTVDGEQLVDSSDIINILQQRIHPDDKVSNEEEEKWRRWVDEHLVHVLSPNIYRTTSEALESFDYISKHGNFSFTERFAVKYAGAAAMYMVSKKLKKKYNIIDERASLYDAANTWMEALNGRDFLGGSKPNLADLAVFGVLRPIRYLRAGKDMVEHTQIGEWYQRMEDEIGQPSRIQE
uniref:Prostaglandin E synthase 2 n=1 Tax=Oryza brachyantha TaxID=4533 RepID=J3LW66_ORYBR